MSWRSEPESWIGQKWVCIESVMDSGVATPVAPPSMVPSVQIEPSERSRRGQMGTSASKHKIPNLGQQRATFQTTDGQRCSLMFQVAGVERPLVSVSQLARTGHRVEFGSVEGAIVHQRTGRKIRLQRVGGVFVLKMRARDNMAARLPAGFCRPGQ